MSQALHVKLLTQDCILGSFTGVLWTLSLEKDFGLQDPKCRESALPALAGGGSREREHDASFSQADHNLMGQMPDEAVL